MMFKEKDSEFIHEALKEQDNLEGYVGTFEDFVKERIYNGYADLYRRNQMPYKSEAQRRFFHSKGAKKAGITKKDVEHWDNASRGKKLPERKKKK